MKLTKEEKYKFRKISFIYPRTKSEINKIESRVSALKVLCPDRDVIVLYSLKQYEIKAEIK